MLGWAVKQRVIEGKYEEAMRDQAWDHADLENELAGLRHEDRAAFRSFAFPAPPR